MPPKPGMIPRLISGWPKVADPPAIRTSQAIAISQPPPNARPLTAAMVMIGERSHSRPSAWMRSRCTRPESTSHFVNALMSAPAQNSAGLGEARIIARTLPWIVLPGPREPPRSTSGPSEFAGGLSSQSTATSPRRSSFTGAVS